jgi:hypothetical protein
LRIDCTAKALKHQFSILRNSIKSTAPPAADKSKATVQKSAAQNTDAAPKKKPAVATAKKNDGLPAEKPTATATTKKRGADAMDDGTVIFDYDAAAAKIEATKKLLGMRKKVKVEEGAAAAAEEQDGDAEEKSVGGGEE